MALTREQIETTPAGPEMDALVAEHLLGWRNVQRRGSAETELLIGKPNLFTGIRPDLESPCIVPRLSVNIAAAWEVVKSVRTRWFSIERTGKGMWRARFGERMVAETAPLAICRAALIWKLEESAE